MINNGENRVLWNLPSDRGMIQWSFPLALFGQHLTSITLIAKRCAGATDESQKNSKFTEPLHSDSIGNNWRLI